MSTTDPLIGTKMGDYTIKSLLGRGGMARVYNGYDENLDRYAAVKVIDSHLISGEDRDEYYQRFQREARAIARLRHPNIVGVYQFGQVKEDYYMAMVFIEGEDLRHILKRHMRNNTMMPNALILKVMRGMTSALDYAHREGVIHRDVKPSNILVMADGNAVLTDFGLALSVPEGTIGNTFGSAHYIAPEQAVSSAQAVPQSDLYSLGICLYEMLTGRVPFDDNSAMSVALKHLSDPPPPPSQIIPSISDEVEEVVIRVLSKEPEDRYESGEAFFNALERAFAISENERTHGLVIGSDDVSAIKRPESSTTENTSPSVPAPVSSLRRERTPTGISKPDPLEQTSAKIKNFEEKREKVRWRTISVVAILLLFILVIGFGIFIFSTLNNDDTQPTSIAAGQVATEDLTEETIETEASTRVAVILQTEEPTTQPASTDEATEEPTIEATKEIIAIGTEEPATSMVETEEPEPMDTATPTPTSPPTATPTNEVAALFDGEFATVSLRYDRQTIVLFNNSGEVVDVSNLIFAREQENGEITFSSNAWRSVASQPPESLPQLDCYQIWTNNIGERLPEPYCDTRHAWRSVAPSRAFWVEDDEFDTFEVRRGEDVLGVCEIEAEACEIPVPLSR